jgi:hypothetical protein
MVIRKCRKIDTQKGSNYGPPFNPRISLKGKASFPSLDVGLIIIHYRLLNGICFNLSAPFIIVKMRSKHH